MVDRAPTLLKQWQSHPRTKKESYSVVGEDSNSCFDNNGAAGNITLTLPRAKTGLGPYRFLVATAHNIVMQPGSADNFRGLGAGVAVTLTVAGQLREIFCNVTGVWEIITLV